MSSTTNRRKPAATTGKLKLILAAGSLIATMIGADMLAARDQHPVAVAPVTAPVVQAFPASGVVIVIPEQRDRPLLTISEAPIPHLAIPPPVAVSKSSK